MPPQTQIMISQWFRIYWVDSLMLSTPVWPGLWISNTLRPGKIGFIWLYGRMVVGWSIDKHMTKELVVNALNVAIKRRNPSLGLICHSDQGSQYCRNTYQDLIKTHGFLCSMSRKGECQDNACAETSSHSLKVEWIYGGPLKSRYKTKREVREYIEVFYNRQRLHSSNQYLSPCDFERVNQSSFLLSA